MAQYIINDIPGDINWECSNDFVTRTLQNAKNLLMCRAGEVPYQRNRGIDPAIFDMPTAESQEYLLDEVVRVLGWEPDIDDVVSAEFMFDSAGTCYISAVVEISDEDE